MSKVINLKANPGNTCSVSYKNIKFSFLLSLLSENIDIINGQHLKLVETLSQPNCFCVRGNHHKSADYLDSLSVLSAELGVIHSLQLAILEGLSVQLISQFPLEEHPAWQTVMVNAVVWTVVRLNRCSGPALDMYLNTIGKIFSS